MKIFVSYTQRDGIIDEPILRKIELSLFRFGVPYIDKLHNQSLFPQNYVINKLKASSLFCAVITPDFFASKWVRLEISISKSIGIPILKIPLNIQPQRTSDEEFPTNFSELFQRNYTIYKK